MVETRVSNTVVRTIVSRGRSERTRPFRRCRPRNHLRHVQSDCAYHGRPLEMKREYCDVVVRLYFKEVA
jgi:hypothetical protein